MKSAPLNEMPKQSAVWVYLVLLLTIAGIYGQVTSHEFVSYDDPIYLSENPVVQSGMTWHGIRSVLTTTSDGNWIPVTWLSYLLGVELFGPEPGPQLLINAGLHGANACLLFHLLSRLTGATWRSAAVSVIFALHPLRVESVAWIAERKDLLSGLFWLLTMLAYVRYRERRKIGRYAALMALFALGLLSKPMLVTLPLVLLLLDYWPLNLFRLNKKSGLLQTLKSTVGEKIPLAVLAAVIGILTVILQRDAKAVTESSWHGIHESIANALLSYLTYLSKFFWPSGLAVFYPFPTSIPVIKWMGAALVLMFVTAVVVYQRERRPYLAVGWFWYLTTIFPVIGIIPVGAQAYADRYTYIPLIGISIMIVWGAAEAARRINFSRSMCASAVAAITIIYSFISWRQTGVWKDSISLYEHAIAVTDNNWLAHNNLAAVLIRKNRLTEADRQLEAALAARPGYAKALANRGLIAAQQGRHKDAIRFYVEAIAFMPIKDAAIHMALGKEFLAVGYREGVQEVVRELDIIAPVEARQLESLLR